MEIVEESRVIFLRIFKKVVGFDKISCMGGKLYHFSEVLIIV